MMDPNVKARWVEALRSGKYEQGLFALRDVDDKFCCLGVLCELYRTESGDGEWTVSKNGTPNLIMFEQDQMTPMEVKEWACLDLRDPYVQRINPDSENPDERQTLSELNDSGVPFSEIANLIEAQL